MSNQILQPCPRALDLHNAAERAILQLLTSGGVVEASFEGRNYRKENISMLQEISEFYRRLAIQRREMPARPGETPVNVSYARVHNGYVLPG